MRGDIAKNQQVGRGHGEVLIEAEHWPAEDTPENQEAEQTEHGGGAARRCPFLESLMEHLCGSRLQCFKTGQRCRAGHRSVRRLSAWEVEITLQCMIEDAQLRTGAFLEHRTDTLLKPGFHVFGEFMPSF